MLVQITENMLVNSDSIDIVEIKTVKGRRMLVVHIGNKVFTATVQIEKLLSDLRSMGVDSNQGFFAG